MGAACVEAKTNKSPFKYTGNQLYPHTHSTCTIITIESTIILCITPCITGYNCCIVLVLLATTVVLFCCNVQDTCTCVLYTVAAAIGGRSRDTCTCTCTQLGNIIVQCSESSWSSLNYREKGVLLKNRKM